MQPSVFWYLSLPVVPCTPQTKRLSGSLRAIQIEQHSSRRVTARRVAAALNARYVNTLCSAGAVGDGLPILGFVGAPAKVALRLDDVLLAEDLIVFE